MDFAPPTATLSVHVAFDHQLADHVLAAMADAVIVLHPDGRVFSANRAAYRLLGYASGELENMAVADIFSQGDSALHTLQLSQMERGEDLRREETEYLDKHGDAIPVSVTGSAILDARGDLAGIVLVARDLRETRRLLSKIKQAKDDVEAQLENARRQLLHAERLATLGTLAGGVGHELGNIAHLHAALVVELKELTAAGSVPERVCRDFAHLGGHISTHAQRLLTLARPGPEFVEPLDFCDAVRETLEMLDSAGKTKYVRVHTTLPSDPIMVAVNRTRIEQILVNLLCNAADALERCKTREIRVVARADGQNAVCEIHDTGCGMDDDTRNHVFDAFFTTKPEGRGTGLGLPVVKQIVESYGGKIGVESELGVGTVFRFTIPRLSKE